MKKKQVLEMLGELDKITFEHYDSIYHAGDADRARHVREREFTKAKHRLRETLNDNWKKYEDPDMLKDLLDSDYGTAMAYRQSLDSISWSVFGILFGVASAMVGWGLLRSWDDIGCADARFSGAVTNLLARCIVFVGAVYLFMLGRLCWYRVHFLRDCYQAHAALLEMMHLRSLHYTHHAFRGERIHVITRSIGLLTWFFPTAAIMAGLVTLQDCTRLWQYVFAGVGAGTSILIWLAHSRFLLEGKRFWLLKLLRIR